MLSWLDNALRTALFWLLLHPNGKIGSFIGDESVEYVSGLRKASIKDFFAMNDAFAYLSARLMLFSSSMGMRLYCATSRKYSKTFRERKSSMCSSTDK